MLRESHTTAFYSTAKLSDKVKKLKRYLNAYIRLSIISDAVKVRLHYWKCPEKPTRTKEIIMAVRMRHKPSRNGDFARFCKAQCTPAACAEVKQCCCSPLPCSKHSVKCKAGSTRNLLSVV